MMILVILIGIATSLCTVFLLYQNEMTYNDRQKIISNMEVEKDWYKFDQVSYEEHLWTRIKLGNPGDLYE